jgi:hypothetical protein
MLAIAAAAAKEEDKKMRADFTGTPPGNRRNRARPAKKEDRAAVLPRVMLRQILPGALTPDLGMAEMLMAKTAKTELVCSTLLKSWA